MVGILLVLLLLSDAGLAKRVRSAVISASLLLAVIQGDGAVVLQLLQLQS